MDYGAFVIWFLVAGTLLIYGPFAAFHILKKKDKQHTHKKVLGVLSAFLVLWSAHVYKTFFLDEALISAAYEGDAIKVQSLLNKGADPEADFEGTTPLQAARSNHHKNVIEILVKAGARK